MWTLDIAAHGDDHIHLRNVRQELTVLGGFHIDTVDLLHQPDGILINLRFRFCTGRIAFKHIAGQLLSQRLRNLTAAGIVDTNKRYLFHFSSFSTSAAFSTLPNATTLSLTTMAGAHFATMQEF